MLVVLVLLIFVPTMVICSGDGNIHLLENEVAFVLKACVNDKTNENNSNNKRDRRSNDNSNGYVTKQPNQYDHEKYTTHNVLDSLNTTENNNDDYGNKATEDKQSKTKRSEPLFNKPDTDQCLSQCVFANLQVVDSRGIPQETELWNLVQSTVTSQQSRAALRDQIRACFQELQSEAEDNGCSYSNKLERCLMLRFSNRRIDAKAKA